MTNDFQQVQASLQEIQNVLGVPFWKHWDFIFATIIGVVGLIYSIMAFVEARKAKQEAQKAKHAATEAGKTVKIQTITIELSDILPKLDRLQPETKYNAARELLNEITRRLRRIISTFEKDPDLSDKITTLRDALDNTKISLNKVRPDSEADEVSGAVYNAVESDFTTISNAVADLLGLMENKTTKFGE